jgi:peptide/nickel transport system permease protein
MLRYTLRRTLTGLAMLLGLSVLVFLLLRAAPGDPIDAYVDPSSAMSPEQIAVLRAQLGLDLPLPVQYLAWLGHALRGDLGHSLQGSGDAVVLLVLTHLGPTLLLMAAAMVLAIGLGIAGGVAGAVRRNGVLDLALSVLAFVFISSPAFLTALLGLYVFAVQMRLLPSGGMLTPGDDFQFADLLRHLVLPAALLAVGHTALIMRYTRSAMLEVLTQDYVRTARAKGVPEFTVVAWHALRNALLPVVTLIGSTIGITVGGAVFIESVFNWPGMGLLMVAAVRARDYPVIMGAALVIGAFVIAMNLLTDLAYAVIDPRVKVG